MVVKTYLPNPGEFCIQCDLEPGIKKVYHAYSMPYSVQSTLQILVQRTHDFESPSTFSLVQ